VRSSVYSPGVGHVHPRLPAVPAEVSLRQIVGALVTGQRGCSTGGDTGCASRGTTILCRQPTGPAHRCVPVGRGAGARDWHGSSSPRPS